ncbi:MAG: class I tRNA ligase family protein [Phycisphaerae bacterium]
MSDQTKRGAYDSRRIEAKWQKHWEENRTFKAPNPGDPDFDATRPKCYVLDMFPYPSGAGLHVGHPVGYCATDICSRYKRMRGFNVLHPIGFDAFGLPAEQYAVETGVHPAVTTRKNIDNMRRQLKMFGFSYDWDRELATTDSGYYKWTQWIFLQLFNSWYDGAIEWTDSQGRKMRGRARPISELKVPAEITAQGERAVRRFVDDHRLAYIAEVEVNWCPALGTVLADEEVTNEGRSDRGDHPVHRRALRQWMLRITRYADRLLQDLDELDWPEPIKIMQRNWIGRSTGAEADFPIASGGRGLPRIDDFQTWFRGRNPEFGKDPDAGVIRIYTTRPDTLFGVTYMVLAPEHPLVDGITTDEHRAAVSEYVELARRKTDIDRTANTKEKTGVFTGAYAFNPVNGERVPIWVADYVLMGYGTGAIMAVPGGDTRDFEFAKTVGLEIRAVVEPTLQWAESIARLPSGSLAEMRQAAVQAIRNSVQRWRSQDDPRRRDQIEFAEEFLEKHRDDVGLQPETIRRMYVSAPQAFEAPFIDEGVGVQSPDGDTVWADDVCSLNGLPTPQAQQKINDWLEQRGLGRAAVKYKLRDWLFSRQRYWGEPIPLLQGGDGEIVSIDESELPVELPELDDFKPHVDDDPDAVISVPLAKAPSAWKCVKRDGHEYRRELNTMPQWAGSCWYYLRFMSPHRDDRFCDATAEEYWSPVDIYVGGAEHAVLHLLYARFWHKVLFDLGHVSTQEPFRKLTNQGMIQAFAYRDPSGRVLRNDQVDERGAGDFVIKETGQPATQFVAKMSKALKNVVNPDDVIAEYGADTFRLYEMYMGPIESSKPWNTRDVPGLLKLLQRIWRLVVDEETDQLSAALTEEPPDAVTRRLLHKTIKTITEDLEQFKFNTAIAAMFEFVNHMTPRKQRCREVIETFVLLIAPFAPHMAEELWQRLGRTDSLAYHRWPDFDPELAKDPEVEIAVQVMGRIKSRIVVSADIDEKALEQAALADERIQREIAGKTVRKVIVVKGRLVNVVTD